MRDGATGVRRNTLNLSILRPDLLPHPTTCFASRIVGILMAHSFVALSALRLKLRLLITQPTRGGSKSIIVCHDSVMMFGRPLWTVVTNTTGPGSSN